MCKLCFPTFIALAHLKAHESDLSRCNIASTFRHRNARDVVRVAMKEILFSTSQTLNNNSAAKRINNMFSVWMHFESRKHMPCINNVDAALIPLNYFHLSKYREYCLNFKDQTIKCERVHSSPYH